MAFVNDLKDQEINEGSDGIEQMWVFYKLTNAILMLSSFHRLCGHKDVNTKVDERPFGFPFDREAAIPLNNDQQ